MSSAQGGAATAREAPPSVEPRVDATPDEQARMPQEMSDRPHPRVDEAAGPAFTEIAQRAYELYLARGGSEGQDIDDWLQAERELRFAPEPSR